MATISLSRAGKAYVRAVVAAGGGVIIYALLQIGLRPPHHYWLLLAALTLFAGPFAIRVPSLRATVSTSEAFVFALVLFFGPAPAALTVALDGLLVSLWARHRNVYRALFNITEPAISVWIAAQLFYALAEVEPLWGQPVGIGQLWLPLLVLTMSYFLLNSWLQATAVWFETQVSPQRFLHTQLSQLSLTSFASVCLVVLLVLNADNLSFAAIGVFVPLLVMSYVSSKMAIERTETQAALGESEKRFRELVENVNDGLWMVDAKTHQVLYVNHAFERIWGRRLGEIAGTHMDWADAIHAEDRERVQNAFRQHAATGYFSEEYRVVQPDGTTRWVNARGFPVKDPGGAIQRIVGIAEDVTERRKFQQLLVRSQKKEGIGRMAGGIAHDFNNILTAILGYSEMILMQIDESKPIWNDVREIQSAGERAASLTRQLLAFSRQQVLKMAVVDLNAVVQDVEKMLQRLLGEDVVIDTDLAGDLGRIKADTSQLEQILVNLAVNARDAMRQGGTLTIATANTELNDTQAAHFVVPAGRYTRLVVSDTGCGMDEHTRARIFEPFFTTKETGQGTGLGLSTVYGTVEQLGGCLAVDTQPQQGTTFTIYLPQTDECLQPAHARPETASLPVGKEHVLLVEDDEAVRAFVASVLRRVGYGIREAAAPQEALAIARNADISFDLVLTDVVMPGMNGKQMVDRLQAYRPHTKVLFISGYDENFFGRGVLNAAHDALLQKPFTAEALLRTVREVLDAPDTSTVEPPHRVMALVERGSAQPTADVCSEGPGASTWSAVGEPVTPYEPVAASAPAADGVGA